MDSAKHLQILQDSSSASAVGPFPPAGSSGDEEARGAGHCRASTGCGAAGGVWRRRTQNRFFFGGGILFWPCEESRLGIEDIRDGDVLESTSRLTETHQQEFPIDGHAKTPTSPASGSWRQELCLTCGGLFVRCCCGGVWTAAMVGKAVTTTRHSRLPQYGQKHPSARIHARGLHERLAEIELPPPNSGPFLTPPRLPQSESPADPSRPPGPLQVLRPLPRLPLQSTRSASLSALLPLAAES